MNDEFIDPLLVNVALSHMQFETIHAYKDGNGRLGRALIPVQMAQLDACAPILYMSEILELYKPSYQRNLMECGRGNVDRIMPVIMKQIVFTKKEVQELSGVSVNIVSKIINQLVDLNIIVPDSSVVKKGYRYQIIYEVFVGTKEF